MGARMFTSPNTLHDPLQRNADAMGRLPVRRNSEETASQKTARSRSTSAGNVPRRKRTKVVNDVRLATSSPTEETVTLETFDTARQEYDEVPDSLAEKFANFVVQVADKSSFSKLRMAPKELQGVYDAAHLERIIGAKIARVIEKLMVEVAKTSERGKQLTYAYEALLRTEEKRNRLFKNEPLDEPDADTTFCLKAYVYSFLWHAKLFREVFCLRPRDAVHVGLRAKCASMWRWSISIDTPKHLEMVLE